PPCSNNPTGDACFSSIWSLKYSSFPAATSPSTLFPSTTLFRSRHRVIGVLALQTRDTSGCTDAKEGAHTFDNQVSTQGDTNKQQTEVDGAALAVLTAQSLFFLVLRCSSRVCVQ